MVRCTGLPPDRRSSCSLLAHLPSLQAHCMQVAMQPLPVVLAKLSYVAVCIHAASQADSSSSLAGPRIWVCALGCGSPTTHLTALFAIGQLQQGA